MGKKKIDELKDVPKERTEAEQIESLKKCIALAEKMLADAKQSEERRNENK